MRTQSTQLSKLTGTAGGAAVCAWAVMGSRYLGSKETIISPVHTSGLFSRTAAARNPEDLRRADL